MSTNTKRNIKRAEKNKIDIRKINNINEYHDILSDVLKRHEAKPVHTSAELIHLQQCFPENIKLYGAYQKDKLLAGTLVFESDRVAHTQYLASSPLGQEMGALDLVISTLLQDIYKNKAYISFGPSTEEGGRVLNEGLIRQKEGFGGRSIVHDFYKLNIK